ncbi:MAG: phage major capsid protein [Actinomycetota bacterium]|nr:phage major capsid protein [Actinomycetota bacterium]
MDPIELRRKRAGLIKQMRDMIDKAEEEKRDLSGEEDESYKKIEEDVRKLDGEIKREETLRSLETDLDKSLNEPHTPAPDDRSANAEPERPRATEEYRKLFWEVVRSRQPNPAEARDLFKGDDPSGGYLVPESYETTLIEALRDVNVMRTLATVVTSSTRVKIPVATTKPTFKYMGEKEEYEKTDMKFGQKAIDAHKAGGIVLVSEELLEDTMFDLEGYIRTQFALGAGELEEEKFVAGSGVGEPTGVIGDAEEGKVGAAEAAVAFDELMDLIHSLRRPYRKKARFLTADSTVLAIMKLKDDDGQYLWQPSVQTGQPDRIRAYPVEVSDDVPAMAASAKSILFGDFSYYRIQDRAGISIQKLVELYSETGQVGFRMRFRNDGRLLLTESVKYFRNAAGG